MKVLFCVRHNFYDAPGGAQIQIVKTKKYLEEIGVACDLTTTPFNIDYNQYDILHLTDLTWIYDNLIYFKEIEKKEFKGKKVLSTIYWPFDDYASKGAPFFQKIIFKLFGINGFERIKALGKFILKKEKIYIQGLKKSYIRNQRDIVKRVDFLLPNSELEMEALNSRLNVNLENYMVVNNAIDTKVFDEILLNNRCEKEDNLIIFVARIDPRKNQNNFLKAMLNTNYKIIFIGNPGPNSTEYYHSLKKMAKERGNVSFISHISQEEVFRYMVKAQVHVLTSWIETPGLVSIEAAYAGCNIVVSDKGSVRDYFKDYAFYCDPNNINDIKTSVVNAMNSSSKNNEFQKLIRQEYTWENTAKQTLKAYKKVLDEG